MFYDLDQGIKAIDENHNLIFNAMKSDYKELLECCLDKVDLNMIDEDGNNVLMRLLKCKFYDLVLKYVSDVNILINHQNNDGDTFAHLLVSINYLDVKDIINELLERNDFIPNIKNNKGETILDKSINENYLYTTSKILNDERFTNINLYSFKNFYEAYIKNNMYGTYSKLNNFSLILESLEKQKELLPNMSKLMNLIKINKEDIEKDFYNLKTNNLENIINNMIKETI